MATRKRTPSKPGVRAAAPQARADVNPEELRKLISEAAYYRAKQRGFKPGHELEDWIQAEAEVMGRIGRDR